MKYKVTDKDSIFFKMIGEKDCLRSCSKIKLRFSNGEASCFYSNEIKEQNINRRV